MRFAVLADIHGNALALQAVLDDMERQGVTGAINLGDIFSGPLDAKGVAHLLAIRQFPTVLGNHDRYLIEQKPDAMGPSDRVAYDQLTQGDLDWLRSLPFSLTLWDEVFACHANPQNDDHYWMEHVDADGTIRQASLDEIEDWLSDEARAASLILCAHTHIPRLARLGGGQILLNPGSVGCPAYDDTEPVTHIMQTGTPNASYAIAHRDDTGPDQAWDITFRSVPYEHDQAATQARENGREDWAKGLESGWY